MKPSSGPRRRLHITCAVEDCYSPKALGVSYHRFPKDRDLNKQWRVLCRVRDVKEPRICSRHFLPTDFKRDLVNELLNRPTKKLLNPDAVPSLYLFKNQKVSPGLSRAQKAKKEKEEKKQRDALIERLLTKGPDPPPLPMEPKYKSIGIQAFECSSSGYQSQITKLNAQKMRLQNTIEQQKVKINELRSSKRKIQTSSNLLQKSLITKKSQTEVILRKKKVKKWSSDDIIFALRLRQMSARTYAFIRRCEHFPLPGLSTLRNWIREFKVEKGFQEIAWSILKERLRTEKDPKFKLASIVYDEIECHNQYFDESQFPVIRKMQVVILRGLYNKWKYVIYQDLDTPVTKSVLDELILKAENIGAQVWTFSLNLHNKEIMEEVILKNNCFTFSNPFDQSRQIYIFPSMPSIVNHVRNIVFDVGIMLNSDSQTVLCKSDFELLLKSNGKESFKFKSEHLDIQAHNRRCNRLALQTFSSTVSKNMEAMELNKEKVNMVQALDAYVDVFNSRSKTYKNKVGSAFGVNLDQQLVAVKEAENLATKMRVMDSITGKPELNMSPFQFGMIIGIQSLTELYNELVVRRGVLDFILTGHLTTELVRSYCNKMGGHLGILEEFETEELFKRSRLVMIGKKNVRASKASSNIDEEIQLEAFEPLFGALPKKVVLDNKKKPSVGKKKLLTGKRKGTSRSQEREEPEEKFKRLELPETIQLPPEIYTF